MTIFVCKTSVKQEQAPNGACSCFLFFRLIFKIGAASVSGIVSLGFPSDGCLGRSQLKVAMDLNISREALSHYENGKRSPDVQMLRTLSRYFNSSIDFLINGKEFEKT